MFSIFAYKIFSECIETYHIIDSVKQPIVNPYKKGSLENILFKKCWIDTVQWHYEDIIRDEHIDPKEALVLKRKIDASNQKRTELVEIIDDYFLHKYKDTVPKKQATVNTESPAWAIDRLSILALKIYHMRIETMRDKALQEHIKKCKEKLDILTEQKHDLSNSIDILIQDIEKGNKIMKVYRQMKMYNDSTLNPILYKKNED